METIFLIIWTILCIMVGFVSSKIAYRVFSKNNVEFDGNIVVYKNEKDDPVCFLEITDEKSLDKDFVKLIIINVNYDSQ